MVSTVKRNVRIHELNNRNIELDQFWYKLLFEGVMGIFTLTLQVTFEKWTIYTDDDVLAPAVSLISRQFPGLIRTITETIMTHNKSTPPTQSRGMYFGMSSPPFIVFFKTCFNASNYFVLRSESTTSKFSSYWSRGLRGSSVKINSPR